ncbi:MAG: amidohydrolase family protein [Bryobacterales bacterium]
MLPLVALLSAIPAFSATVLHCGKLIDVENLQVREQMSVVVRDGSIERVAPGYVTPASGDEAIDLKSQTCMPGWMDMHVHLVSEINPKSYEEGFRLNPADNAYRAAANAKKTLLAGFTTVRDLGHARPSLDLAQTGDRPRSSGGPDDLQCGQSARDNRGPCRSDERHPLGHDGRPRT